MKVDQLVKLERPKMTENTKTKYSGPTTYLGQEVSMYYHPSRFISSLLSFTLHTGYSGVALIAPMGHGKTTLVNCLLHRIHTYTELKHPRFKTLPKFRIVHAGAYEFTHQKEFYESLPKEPHLIVYDDVSGTLEQMPESKVSECFEALTLIRHTIGTENPVITFVVCHYSKIIPKDFRAQLPYKVFLAMGDEEQTNVKQTFDKKSMSYKTLMRYAGIYQSQFEHHGFYLRTSSGAKKWYETDFPVRAGCVTTLAWTDFILFGEESCELCRKKNTARFIEAQILYDKIVKNYGKFGKQALRYWLYKQGLYNALPKHLSLALRFVEKVFSFAKTDNKELLKIIHREAKTKYVEKFNIPRKRQEKEFDELAEFVTVKPEIQEAIKTAMNNFF